MHFKFYAIFAVTFLTIFFILLWNFAVNLDTINSNKSTYRKFTTEMVRDFSYPVARRDESVVDDFHGTKVADPYRWLEDPDSEETKQFVEAENKIAQPFLENCNKWKEINEKLTALWNYPKYTVPDRHGKYYFSYQNSGLQNQKYVNVVWIIRVHFGSLLTLWFIFSVFCTNKVRWTRSQLCFSTRIHYQRTEPLL